MAAAIEGHTWCLNVDGVPDGMYNKHIVPDGGIGYHLGDIIKWIGGHWRGHIILLHMDFAAKSCSGVGVYNCNKF